MLGYSAYFSYNISIIVDLFVLCSLAKIAKTVPNVASFSIKNLYTLIR
jgi:hypothetical protein